VPLREDDAAVTRPHSRTQRGAAGSALHAFGFFFDNWLGYLLVLRPLMARTGLVIYDRYFHDLLVDQKRYRYGGPLWLVRLLLRFLPGPDSLLLVFDASEKLIWSRKQQLPREALKPLRDKYRQLARLWPNAHLVKNEKRVETSAAAASRIVFEHLAKRFERRYTRWASLT
jgi:thymidylate kinase